MSKAYTSGELGNVMSFKAIFTDDFLNILEDGRGITETDRDKVYLKAEEFGVIYSDSEIDNLIRRAVTIYNPQTTAYELGQIIKESKGIELCQE